MMDASGNSIPAHFLTVLKSSPRDMFMDFAEGGRGEREGEREREKERNIDQLFPTCALTNDRPRYLGTCSYWGSNLQPFGVWEDAPAN